MNTLQQGQQLNAGDRLDSTNGRVNLIMQSDGNLVLYRTIVGLPLWASNTSQQPVTRVTMQSDGNFVAYSANGTPYWATATNGHPGSRVVLQDDGNLVVYDPTNNPLWASNTVQNWTTQNKVSGFLPTTSGLHFVNSPPHAPLLNIQVGPVSVPIGDAANGLCGGMVFAVRDYFESGLLLPADTACPASGPLFDYIVMRLFDSFSLPAGPLLYMTLMNPSLPDHETWASLVGLAPHGRAWVMIKDEWPKIKADIDGGRLSPIGLIEIKSANPSDLGKNHQILAYGYDQLGNDLAIRVYDPNHPDSDDVALRLNVGDPKHTTIVSESTGEMPVCFFRTDYALKNPPVQASTKRQKAAFKSSGGKFVVAEGGGGGAVNATPDAVGPWETFTLEKPGSQPVASGDLVNIEVNNGQFLVAEGGGGGEVRADRSTPRQWERFVILKRSENTTVAGTISSGDSVALRANNDQHLVAEGGGGGVVNANRDVIGPWETFQITLLQ